MVRRWAREELECWSTQNWEKIKERDGFQTRNELEEEVIAKKARMVMWKMGMDVKVSGYQLQAQVKEGGDQNNHDKETEGGGGEYERFLHAHKGRTGSGRTGGVQARQGLDSPDNG